MTRECHISFTVSEALEANFEAVWEKLVDWDSHSDWIPMTVVETLDSKQFTAWSGPLVKLGTKKVSLEDRMVADIVSKDENVGELHVTKTGPHIVGEVTVTVTRTGDNTCHIDWRETVVVPNLPQWASKPAGHVGKLGFKAALWKLQRLIELEAPGGLVADRSANRPNLVSRKRHGK